MRSAAVAGLTKASLCRLAPTARYGLQVWYAEASAVRRGRCMRTRSFGLPLARTRSAVPAPLSRVEIRALATAGPELGPRCAGAAVRSVEAPGTGGSRFLPPGRQIRGR